MEWQRRTFAAPGLQDKMHSALSCSRNERPNRHRSFSFFHQLASDNIDPGIEEQYRRENAVDEITHNIVTKNMCALVCHDALEIQAIEVDSNIAR